MLKNDWKWLFGFPKVQWLHLTGGMDKSVRCSCQIISGFNVLKISKIGYFVTELFEKQKGGRFSRHRVAIFIVLCRLCCAVDKASNMPGVQSMLQWNQQLFLDRRFTGDTVWSTNSLSTTKQFILTSRHWQERPELAVCVSNCCRQPPR